jgi:hypothetical protein
MANDLKYDFTLRISNKNKQMKNLGILKAKVKTTKLTKENRFICLVYDTCLDVYQKFNDKKIAEAMSFPAHIKYERDYLKNLNKKKLVYKKINNKYELLKDETEEDQNIGSLTPFFELILNNSTNGMENFLGFKFDMQKNILVKKNNKHIEIHLYKYKTRGDVIESWAISLINSENNIPIKEKAILKNKFTTVELTWTFENISNIDIIIWKKALKKLLSAKQNKLFIPDWNKIEDSFDTN